MRQISRFTLFFILISTLSKGYASAPPLFDWQKCLGGSGQDMPVKMIRSFDGGLLMLGSTGSSNGDVSLSHGSNDLWLTKTDSMGNLIWERTYGGSNIDIGTGIIQLPGGDLLLSGYTGSFDGDISHQHGNFDAWVIRTTSNGNIIWEKTFGGSLVDLIYAMIQTSDGGILLGGGTYSNDGDVNGNHGDQDFWLLKLDDSGNLVWQKSMGGSGLDVCYSIDETSASEIIACGSTNSNDGDVSGQHGNTDFWVIKLTSGGNKIWTRCFGGSDQESAFAISSNSNNHFLVSGYSKSSDGDLQQNSGYNDIWTLQLGQNGTIQNQRIIGGTGADIAFSSISSMDGGYLLACGTTSNDGDVDGNHGQEDILLIKLDQQLSTEWMKCQGGSGNERPSSILQTRDGSFLFSGYTYSNDGNVSGNHGASDYWIVRLSCKVPVSAFSTPFDSLCTGMSVAFTNQSANASAFRWLVNSQNLTTQENASFPLPNTGVYTVQLVAQTCYSSDTSVKRITAISKPQIKISLSGAHLCLGDSILLSATSGSSYIWNTGATSCDIYVSSRGPFFVTVYTSGCPSHSDTVTLSASAKPNLELGPDTTICSGSSLLLVAGNNSAFNYTWQDGSSLNQLVVTTAGTYFVKISDNYCSSSDTIHVDTVSCNLPVASFTVANQDICERGTISFVNNSVQSVSYNWTFPGGYPASSSLENPVVSYETPGTYNVILTVTNSQGSQTLMRWNYIVVHANPARPVIYVNGFTLSTNPAQSYQWYWNNSMLPGACLNYLQVSQDGFYQVLIRDQYQCESKSDSVYVSITATENESNSGSMELYPIPALEKITVKLNYESATINLIRVISISGEEMFKSDNVPHGSYDGIAINTSGLSTGMYFLELTNSNGKRIIKKFQKN